MNQRQKRLLKILIQNNEYITVQTLADDLSVSLRTIHNDLKDIEIFLNQKNIILDKKRNAGIKIDAPCSIKKSLLNYTNEKKEEVDILSTKMRRMKIFSHLLTHREGSSLNKLS